MEITVSLVLAEAAYGEENGEEFASRPESIRRKDLQFCQKAIVNKVNWVD